MESDRPQLFKEIDLLREKLSASEKENKTLKEILGCAEEKVALMGKEIRNCHCCLSEKEEALQEYLSFCSDYSESMSSLTDRIFQQNEEHKKLQDELLKEKKNFLSEKAKLQMDLAQIEERYKLELPEREEAMQKQLSFLSDYSESLSSLTDRVIEQKEENKKLEEELLKKKNDFLSEEAKWTEEMEGLRAENIQLQAKSKKKSVWSRVFRKKKTPDIHG